MADEARRCERVARIDEIFSRAIRLHETVRRLDPAPLLACVDAIVGALARHGKVLVFGNGGSAADAQHLAAEFVGRFAAERRALPAVALTADTSVVTSIGNDYGFDQIFARQIEALGGAADVALGISTSGESRNVLAAFAAAEKLGLTRIALTGCNGGPIGRAADIHLNVPDASTARVQEVHRTLVHIVCDLVERTLAR